MSKKIISPTEFKCRNCSGVFSFLDDLTLHSITGHGEDWPKTELIYLVDTIVERTSNAFSWNVYGERRWRSCTRTLLLRGYNELEVEAILRSKWMRWAADAMHPRQPNSADVLRCIERSYEVFINGLPDLVAGTFEGE